MSGALDRVAQLADVARPGVGDEQLLRGGRELRAADAPPAARRTRGTAGERQDVLRPLAQRRDHDLHDVEPVEQVLAEAARLHLRVEVAVRRGHDRARPRAGSGSRPRARTLLLEEAEQLRLERGRELADLVEEERAALGRLHAARLIAHGAGERAAHVAEQLAREQLLGQRGAVHDDEGPVGAAGSGRGARAPGRPSPCRSRRGAAPPRHGSPRARRSPAPPACAATRSRAAPRAQLPRGAPPARRGEATARAARARGRPGGGFAAGVNGFGR